MGTGGTERHPLCDNWGIAHVYGKTDADAVFGMEYAQAEDDFNRVESNYIDALGWRSEADGRAALWQPGAAGQDAPHRRALQDA
jgi:acyl-homoserine lactone acylase PvdQ